MQPSIEELRGKAMERARKREYATAADIHRQISKLLEDKGDPRGAAKASEEAAEIYAFGRRSAESARESTRAAKLYEEAGEHELAAVNWGSAAHGHMRVGNMRQSAYAYEEAGKAYARQGDGLMKSDPKGACDAFDMAARAHTEEGFALGDMGDPTRASWAYAKVGDAGMKAAKASLGQKDWSAAATFFGRAGEAYYHSDTPKKALAAYAKARSLHNSMARRLQNEGLRHHALEQLKESADLMHGTAEVYSMVEPARARAYYKKAADAFVENGRAWMKASMPKEAAMSHGSAAFINREMREYDRSGRLFNKAARLFSRARNHGHAGEAHLEAMRSYAAMHRYDLAHKSGKRAAAEYWRARDIPKWGLSHILARVAKARKRY
ncbi:MAG: hypothetical protein JXB14_02725 [Candidatus Altiarchaeota archaeon]|nr:hypothetical protein [Candidatus Altiarchaeota archaeon]